MSKEHMKGKTVIVTGSNRGIGREACKLYAQRRMYIHYNCNHLCPGVVLHIWIHIMIQIGV